MFEFKVTHQDDTGARTGEFVTPHGVLETPVFAPVGTAATVKATQPRDLVELGASLVLSNTYHLYLRPGDEVVRDMGGLHNFMQWQGPMLTDSGGFQVFSLSDSNKIDQDGVTFKSHLDGSKHRFTPESSIAIQENLGADIIMAFDECPPPDNHEYVKRSLTRTHPWLLRCIEAKKRDDQALFGIVQGGIFRDLREESAKFMIDLDLPGYAIGGLAVGETKLQMHQALEWLHPILPQNKPRYLMGVGTPEDLINGVLRGVDIFDCVLPTRLARHGTAFVKGGRMNLRKAMYERDERPISPDSPISQYSRAYLRHLVRSNEILASVLLSMHNIGFLINVIKDMRLAIRENRLQAYADEYLSHY